LVNYPSQASQAQLAEFVAAELPAQLKADQDRAPVQALE
jgi:hypothetical protein